MNLEYLPATGAARAELVLLHGWGANREIWRPLLARLRPWANVTLLDIPGCAPGLPAANGGNLDDTLAAVLAQCPPAAVYVGWSLGGQLALALAARFPGRVRGVVTLCSNPRFVAADDWPGMAPEEFARFAAAVARGPAAALKRFDALQRQGAAHGQVLQRELDALRRAAASTDLGAGLAWLAQLDQRALLQQLQCPRLHLFAEHDALVPVAVAARLAESAGAQLSVLPDACHLAPLQAADAIAGALRAFVDDLGTPGTVHAARGDLDKRDVAASFSRAAAAYDGAAHLQRTVGARLLDNLDRVPGQPENVLDLGCGTGQFAAELRQRFPGARYLGLDIAAGMVAHARRRCAASNGGGDWLVADAEALPLATASVDLVFSSLALQWCQRPAHIFAELARVLRPGGICVFTSLGPRSLCELRAAWAAVDARQHVNSFLPGAELAAAARRVPGLRLDMASSEISLQYAGVRELLAELKALGAHNLNRGRPRGLTGPGALRGMLQAYEGWRRDGMLPATYEVLYGVLEKA